VEIIKSTVLSAACVLMGITSLMEYAQDALIIDSSTLILSNVYATKVLTLFLINVYRLVKRIK